MKTNVKKMIIAGMVLATTSSAYSQTAAQTASEVSAQTKITRGYIDNLLEKVNNKTIDSNFNVTDYLAQSQEYKNRVEASLKKFEDALEKDILTKASFWINQYNSIYNSKDISGEQKRIVLAQRLVVLNKEFEKISVSYKKAIGEVYSLVPFAGLDTKLSFPSNVKVYDDYRLKKEAIPVDLIVNSKTKISSSFFLENNYRHNNSYYYDIIFGDKKFKYDLDNKNKALKVSCGNGFFNSSCTYTFNFTEVFLLDSEESNAVKDHLIQLGYAKNFYSTIKGSCKSSLCIGLKSGDFLDLSAMIKNLLDRSIHLRLPDGNVLKIEALNLDLNPSNSILSVVNYPEDLPFDI